MHNFLCFSAIYNNLSPPNSEAKIRAQILTAWRQKDKPGDATGLSWWVGVLGRDKIRACISSGTPHRARVRLLILN